jgi:hypothetical protein
MTIKRLLSTSLVLILPLLTKADGQTVPTIAVVASLTAVVVIGLSVALGISYIFRNLMQSYRNENRSHIWYMTLFTLLVPILYAVAGAYLLHGIEYRYGYLTKELINIFVFALMVVVGFYVGYFMTPAEKRESTAENKKEARFLLMFCWILCFGAIFVWRLIPVLEYKQVLDKSNPQEQKATGPATEHMQRVLNAIFMEVKWNEESKSFTARTKNGRSINAGYDAHSNLYYMKFSLAKEPATTDTLSWINKLELIYPFMSSSEHTDAIASLENKRFGFGTTEENDEFAVSVKRGYLIITYNREKKLMEISWPAWWDSESSAP